MHRWLLVGVLLAGAGATWDRVKDRPAATDAESRSRVTVSRWQLKDIGSGERCEIALSGDRLPASAEISLGDECAAVDDRLSGTMMLGEHDNKFTLAGADGAVAIEFVQTDGAVYESVKAGAPIIMLSRAD